MFSQGVSKARIRHIFTPNPSLVSRQAFAWVYWVDRLVFSEAHYGRFGV